MDSQKNVNPRLRHLREQPITQQAGQSPPSVVPPYGVANISQSQRQPESMLDRRGSTHVRMSEQRQAVDPYLYRSDYGDPVVDSPQFGLVCSQPLSVMLTQEQILKNY